MSDIDRSMKKCIDDIWNTQDKDNSGFLDKNETKNFIKDTLTEMGESGEFSEDDFEACFKEFDNDGNGTISKDQMITFIKKVAGLETRSDTKASSHLNTGIMEDSKQKELNWVLHQIRDTNMNTDIALVIPKTGNIMKTLFGNLANSKHFQEDMDLFQTQWMYIGENARRALIFQDSNTSDGQKGKLYYKSMADKIVCDLQLRKSISCKVLILSTSNEEYLGIFASQFRFANYEYTFKTDPSQYSKKKLQESSEADPRIKKYLKRIESYEIMTPLVNVLEDKRIKFWNVIAQCREFTRNLTNTRGGIADPDYMEHQVLELIKNYGDKVDIKILKGNELEQNGMNLIYNVGKGATSEPRCITVLYKGNSESNVIDIALVGKGVTFDTGGLNIKMTGSIELMYYDKGGACAVLGALKGALELNIKKNIVFGFGFVENAIGSKAYKPKDILTSLKGLTVEVDNTDMEGRLVLADVLTFIQNEYNPKRIIDIATLTGSIGMALGIETAGLFTNDNDFGQEFLISGNSVFEKYYQLPILECQQKMINGICADLKNANGSNNYGGASRAAAFLQRFIEEGVQWIHLDIAYAHVNLATESSNGFGTQTLLHYLMK